MVAGGLKVSTFERFFSKITQKNKKFMDFMFIIDKRYLSEALLSSSVLIDHLFNIHISDKINYKHNLVNYREKGNIGMEFG